MYDLVCRKSISILSVMALAVAMLAQPCAVQCAAKSQAQVQESYDMLPETARARFEADGWRVEVVPNSQLAAMYDIPKGYKAAGVTDEDEKVIYINSDVDQKGTVIHEFAHWVEDNGGCRSATPEFQAIYAEEGHNYTSYGATSASEFYSEVLRGMYVDNAAVLAKCPKAAAYVMADIKSF